MGGSSSSTENLKKKFCFSKDELEYLQKIFNERLASSQNKGQVDENKLVNFINMNNQFPKKFVTWIKTLKEGNQTIDFDTFAGAIELIVKESSQYFFQKFNFVTFDKWHLFYCISAGTTLNDVKEVTKEQATTYLCELFACFGDKSDESSLKSAVDSVLMNLYEKTDKIEWRDFKYDLKKHLVSMTKLVRQYFANRFTDPNNKFKLPAIDGSSYVLNNDILKLFYLSNSDFQQVAKLDMLYSTSKSGTSFNRLALAIKGYDGPTLVLCEHVDKADPDHGKPNQRSFWFGGYAHREWDDQLGYGGDSETYIFSLEPKFKNFYVYNGEGGSNYQYLNSRKIQHSKYKVGLGFGGKEYKNYRLWIDDELETESYVGPDDATFAKGYLCDPSITKFNFQHVEIWGLGGPKALMKQEEFRESESKMIEKSRKVDKKQFLDSGFDKEFLFEKTFSQANNKHDGTDFREEMEDDGKKK